MDHLDTSAREKILAATHQLLTESGFESLTTRNICKTAGVAYGSFYYNFNGKEDLLYEYGKESFISLLNTLSMPEDLKNGDFIRQIQWAFCVYAYFCTQVGPEFVKYVYEHNPSDIFYDVCFRQVTKKQLESALEKGLLDSKREHLHLIMEDLQILYKGAIRQWCSSPEARKQMNDWSRDMVTTNSDHFIWKDYLDFGEDAGLVSILSRLIYRFIYSFSSYQYRMVFYANRAWRDNWQDYVH